MRWRWPRPTSLRARLVRDTLLAFLLASVFYVGVLQGIFREGSELMVRDGLLGQAEDLEDALSFDEAGAPSLTLHEPMKWGYDAYFQNLKYRVLDGQGNVLLASDGGRMAFKRMEDTAARLEDDYFQTGNGLHVATLPVRGEHGRIFIQTARSDRFFDLTAEAMLPVVVETSTAVGAIALLLFGLVILVGVRFSLKPVRRASDQVEAINPQNLSTRISTRDMPAEILPLVDGINRSLGRIEGAFMVQQRFLANAAHELKTPLSILRGQVELRIGVDERAPLLQEIDTMARTVRQLLQLAEASDIGGYRFAPVELAGIVQDTVSMVGSLAAASRVWLAVEHTSGDTRVLGDRAAIQIALRNVLENAIHHAPPQSLVDIRVGDCWISVQDTGIGLSDEAREHLFERFWRLDRSGSGTGLGMSIVKEIMDAHHGEVVAANARAGPGAVFTLIFPSESR